MAEYIVKSENTKLFSLFFNDKELGTLHYENWFSFKASIQVEKNREYHVTPKGFWGTTIEVKKQYGDVLIKMKMNWKGNIVIQTNLDKVERDFLLIQKSMLKNVFILQDKDERELLVIKPDFKWKKINYDYEINSTPAFDLLPDNSLLLLVVIHCANYYMTMMMTTIAAST